MGESDSAEKVCEYLKSTLNIVSSVVDHFREEKMSVSATANASEEDLKAIGLLRKGDIISVKKFCQDALKNEEQKEKSAEKVALLESIMQNNKPKRKLRDSEHSRPFKMKIQENQVSKKVQLGWLHYDDKQNRYVAVRTPRGGGTRDISLPLNTTANEVIEIGKELFFPNAVSYYGMLSEMEFSLANFRQEVIETLHVDNRIVPFTLEQYIFSTKLQKLRLYLASKKKDIKELPKTEATQNSERTLHSDLLDDAFDDSVFLYSVFDHNTSNTITTGQYNLNFINAKDDIGDSEGNRKEHLEIEKLEQAGTSGCQGLAGRPDGGIDMNMHIQSMFDLNGSRELQAEQEQTCIDSDKAKSAKRRQELLKELEEVEKQENLRQSRIQRLPEEPSPGKDTVIIKVKHVTLGAIQRHFAANDSMLPVYDWVGSKSIVPMHFQLSSAQGLIYKPDQSVQDVKDSTLHMTECTATPGIEDDDITFKGLGNENADDVNDTIPLDVQQNSQSSLDISSPEMGEAVPATSINSQQDMEATSSRENNTYSEPGMRFRQVYLRSFLASQGRSLNEDDSEYDNQEAISDSGATNKVVEIHRSKIKDELMQLFSDPAIMEESLDFRVIDDRGKTEEGQGVGVTREVFATFWQQIFISLTVGDVEKVPCIRHDHQKGEWEAIARILLYGLQCTGYFPVGVSPIFLVTCLFGEESISKEELLDSFLYYVTADEREVIKNCLSGQLPYDDDDLLDVLSSYKWYKRPTEQNFRSLLTELAHQELIQKPRYVGECWSPIVKSLKEKESFSSLRNVKEFCECRKPTAKKVIKALRAKINHESDQQSYDFLKKFIKSLDSASLKIFLKFVTGSDVLVCDSIEVGFTLIDGFERRPTAHTCGPLLLVPSTYQSYNELAEEFNNILREKAAWTFNIV